MRARLTALFGRYWLALFIFVSLGYVVIYVLGEMTRLEQMLRVSMLPLALTFLMQCSFWLLASLLWRALVQQVSHRPLAIMESFAQLCVVNLGKYLPGKVWGMVARGSRMYQQHGIALEQIVQSTLLEQFYLFCSAAVVALFCLGLFLDGPWRLAAMVLAALIVIMGASFGGSTLRLMVRAGQKLSPKSSTLSFEMTDLRIDYYQSYLVAYAGVWLLLGATLYGVYLSFFSASPSWFTFLVMVIAAITGYTAGFLAVFAPGGVGVREAVGSAILAYVMPIGDALLLSLIFRLWTTAAEGLAGGLSLVLLRARTSASA